MGTGPDVTRTVPRPQSGARQNTAQPCGTRSGMQARQCLGPREGWLGALWLGFGLSACLELIKSLLPQRGLGLSLELSGWAQV